MLYNHKYKGKIFNKGVFVFEGELLFDKNWTGKDYDKNIIYELNNGSGKTREYYNNGELKYEGDYLNGK